MAIINCSECSKEISDKATTCPSCGAPGVAKKYPQDVNIDNEPIDVKVVEIEMSFMAMVTFLVKLAFAAIPAAIIIFIMSALFYGVLATMFHR